MIAPISRYVIILVTFQPCKENFPCKFSLLNFWVSFPCSFYCFSSVSCYSNVNATSVPVAHGLWAFHGRVLWSRQLLYIVTYLPKQNLNSILWSLNWMNISLWLFLLFLQKRICSPGQVLKYYLSCFSMEEY